PAALPIGKELNRLPARVRSGGPGRAGSVVRLTAIRCARVSIPVMEVSVRHKLWPVLVLSAGLLAGCGTQVVNPVTGQTERTVMDEPMEIAQGRQAHEELLKADGGAYPDAKLQAYVDGVGRRLAANSHRAHLPWTFTVLDSPEVNAFALPGGYVYVTRG